MSSEEHDSFDDDNFDDYEHHHIINRIKSLNLSTIPIASEYDFLTRQDVLNLALAHMQSVAQCLSVSEEAANVMLKLSRYDKEALLKSPKQPPLLPTAASSQSSFSDGAHVDCKICSETVDAHEATGLSCGHAFCRLCWLDYAALTINTKGFNSVQMACPQHGCKQIACDSFVEELLRSHDRTALLEKYRTFEVDFYVFNKASLKNCPSETCSLFVQRKESKGSRSDFGVCRCGFKFCFPCGKESHFPASCENTAAWDKKFASESLTANYIIVNTKNCPRCGVRIEKEKGCNHMDCYSCKFMFCWLCMGDWTTHGSKTGGFYRCNRYREQHQSKKNKSAESSEKIKYLFYFQRYQNHDQSLQFAKRNLLEIERKIEVLRKADSSSSWTDFAYLRNAILDLTECRKTLKYTYIFGYYMENSPEKEFFEFLQQDLERNTELLHEYIEAPVDELDKEKIINQTNVTKKFAASFLEGVSNKFHFIK